MTLGELILNVKDKTGESYAQMAARAKDRGYSLTSGTIHKLATQRVPMVPGRDTLLGLSVALGVAVEEVALSAVESLGIELSPQVTNESRARAWLTLTEGRSDAEVSHLLRVTRTVADALDSAAGPAAESDAPRSDSGTERGTGDAPRE